MTQRETQKASANMIKYGGSFMQNLGKALRVADRENTGKIISTWGSEIKQYLKYE